jgi:hypothetical protein
MCIYLFIYYKELYELKHSMKVTNKKKVYKMANVLSTQNAMNSNWLCNDGWGWKHIHNLAHCGHRESLLHILVKGY